MKKIFWALFLSVGGFAQADFADDQYTDHPEILLRIVTAAEHNDHLKSHVDGSMVLYLRSAEYIGPLDASFGTVHVARLFYIRSAPRGSKLPSRGHTFIAFLDQQFQIRDWWEMDSPDNPLSADGTKLLSGPVVVMDYAHLPEHGTVLFDGKEVRVPKWNKP